MPNTEGVVCWQGWDIFTNTPGEHVMCLEQYAFYVDRAGMWGCRSVGSASDRHAANAGSIPWCGKGFFSQSQLSVQILFLCPPPPPRGVQSHTLTYVRTLKIP